jgi:tRNA threonylcarbamoyladenosine biosynthesis protein TsaB
MTSRGLCKVDGLLEQSLTTGPVLGLETSTAIASLGLVAGGRIVATLSHRATSHGASLPGAVDEILARAGLRLNDLSAIAVGIGPGSFTGLRIGLSYAKGVAMASGCRLVGVPGFDSIAIASIEHRKLPDRGLVCVVLDARRDEVYAALYRVGADRLEKLEEEFVVGLEDLASRIAEDALLVGDTKAVEAAALIGSRGHAVAVLETGTLEMRGGCVAAVGAAMLSRGEVGRPESLEPLYIRTPEVTFKPVKNPVGSATEGLWSGEKKNSFGSI